MFVRPLPQGDHTLITRELAHMGHQEPGAVLAHAERHVAYKLTGVSREAAEALQAWVQQAPGGWWYGTVGASTATVDCLCGGSAALFAALGEAARQYPHLQAVVAAFEQAHIRQAATLAHFTVGQMTWELGRRTYVMGILNVTPDSFSDGGLYLQPEQALKHAEAMLAAGADLIDVGGQSSRPGAAPIPPEVERERVVPVVRELVKHYGAPVSVDTYRASVAAAALDAGAAVINDISALRFDAQMAPLIARRQASVVLMHMQGTPQTMQHAPTYRHVVDDVYAFLAERLDYAMAYGIPRQRIVLDPGFGFGKTIQHNLTLLRSLEQFHPLGQPLLVGTSRKSFLGRLLRRQLWDRLEGTLATVIYAALHGATVVRVHDVSAVAQAVRLLAALEASSLSAFDMA